MVRGGVRSENELIFEPERVLHVARRVVVRNIERFEAEVFRFNLRSVDDGEAHALEDIFKFHLRERNRMERAEAATFSGRGEIEFVRLAARRARLESLLHFDEFRRRKGLQLVKFLPESLLFLDRHFTEVGVLRERRNRALAT